ncbi:class C sortase [Enterococcus xiangfangensis]|uniref:class C sortase n=1 Tax=Enterococcus xiangfangensis TaxID=1296537 RepID=UPI0010F58873|nr:class C sortase [Enterococcus xiangfangensis]MBM7712202.1 sortase A [Enterococcus xiangfangensis]
MAKKKVDKKKRKKRIIYTFFSSVILLGVLLLLAPIFFDMIDLAKRKDMVADYEQKVPEKGNATIELIKKYNKMIYQQQKGEAAEEVKITDIQSDLKTPIGFVNIPSIHLINMVIHFGDSDWVLNHGIGTLPFTTLPIGGKNTLSGVTGHSGLANQILFDNIRYLKNGDVFYLNAFGKETAYKVYDKKVVDPKDKDAVKAFYIQQDKDLAALMTCTPLFINSHRLVVYGKRIPLKAAKEVKTVHRTVWSLDTIWIATLLIFLLLLLLWLIYRYFRDRRKEKQPEDELGDSEHTDEANDVKTDD